MSDNLKLTRCNQNLVFLGAQTKEGEVILGVYIPDCAPRLHGEAAEKSGVLHSSGVIQSSSDGDTWKREPARLDGHKRASDASSASQLTLCIDNYSSNHSFVSLNPFKCFLNLCLWDTKTITLIILNNKVPLQLKTYESK